MGELTDHKCAEAHCQYPSAVRVRLAVRKSARRDLLLLQTGRGAVFDGAA